MSVMTLGTAEGGLRSLEVWKAHTTFKGSWGSLGPTFGSGAQLMEVHVGCSGRLFGVTMMLHLRSDGRTLG